MSISWHLSLARLKTALEKLSTVLLDLLFPVRCLECRAFKSALRNPHGYLCPACSEKIKLNAWLFCPVCNRKLINLQPCPTHSGLTLKVLGAACNYNQLLLKKLVWQYKYGFKEPLAKPLALVLNSYFQKVFLPLLDSTENLIVCPLPLYPARERWRGFNQAQLLAESFAGQNNLPCLALLKRIKFQQPQMEIKIRQQRFTNIKDSFYALSEINLHNQTIILVDDIAASGATLIEAAKVLRQAGARKVYGLVLARSL